MVSDKNLSKVKESTVTKFEKKLLIIVAIFSFLLYANTIPNGYNLDDELVTINHRLTSQGIKAIPEIFTSPYYKDAAGNQYEYRPVTLATFAIEHQFFGDNAHVSHLINTLIYVLLSVVFFLTLLKLFKNFNYVIPLTITLLFVAHPLHTEAVAGIKSRDEILCFLGGILSLFYSLRFAEQGKVKDYLLFVFFFAFGLLSKKSIIPFALVIPITFLFFYKLSFLRIILLTLPLSLISGLFWPFSILWQKILFSVVLFIVPVILYAIINRGMVISDIRDFFQKVVPLESIITKSLFLRLFEKESINASVIQIYFLPIVGLLTSVFILYDLKIVAFIFLLFLIVLYFKSSSESRNYVLLDIALFLGPIAFFYVLKYVVWVVLFVILSEYFKGRKKTDFRLFISALLLLPALSLGHKSFGVTMFSLLIIPLFLAAISFISFRIRKAQIAGGILLVVASVLLIFSSNLLADSILFSLIGILLLIIYFDKQKHILDPIKLLVFLIPLALFLNLNQVKWNKIAKFNGKSVNEFLQTKIDLPNRLNAEVRFIPASGRELDFIEVPVKNSDPLSIRLGTSFFVLGKYLKLMVFPHPLGFYYGYAQIEPVPWYNYWSLFSIFFHFILFASALFFYKKHRIYSYGIFFYFLCISAFSNIAAPVAGMMADRLTFVASAGFCIALGYGLSVLFKIDIKSPVVKLGFSQKGCLVIAAILLLYSVKSFSRNFQWKDHSTLMSNDIKYLDKSVQANNLLAVHLVRKSFETKPEPAKEKLWSNAVKYFNRAVEIYPKADFVWYDLGHTYLLQNNLPDALHAFLKTAEIDPTYLDAWVRAGAILMDQKKFSEAAFCLEKAIAIDSSNIQAFTSLSQAYFSQKNFEKSISINLLAIEKFPGSYDPVVNIGKTYFTLGDKKNALTYFEKAYKLNPNDKNLVLTMASIYQEFGDAKSAEFYNKRVGQITPK